MKRRRVGAVLAAASITVAFAVAACGKKTEQGTSGTPSDLDTLAFAPESVQVRADVDSGNAQLLQAWKSGSGDLFANVFVEDGILVRGGGMIQGRDSITAVMGRTFSETRMRRGSITTLRLQVAGDIARETGNYVFELVPVRGGRAEVDSGTYEKTWKFTSGQWKLVRDVAIRAGRATS